MCLLHVTQIHKHDDISVGGKNDRGLALLWGKLTSSETQSLGSSDDKSILVADMQEVDLMAAQSKPLHPSLPP